MIPSKSLIVVEFMCGSKSLTKEAEKRGHKCYTIDWDKKWNPDLCIDILKFEISMLPEEFRCPDFAWFSPQCTKFSHANRKGIPDLTMANLYVQKCIDVKNMLLKINPNLIWIIENPQTGTLKNQIYMQGIPFTDASYCKYGLPYRKQTRFWNNINLELKTCKKDCEFLDGKKHIMSVGNGRKEYTKVLKYSYDKKVKYKVPELLCIDILKQAEVKVDGTTTDGIPPKA
jgi:hypothetical protein